VIPLGKALTFYGIVVGLALKKLDDEGMYLCSYYNAESNENRLDPIHEDDIVVGGKIHEVDTSNEVLEVEDAGCEGGACKI
jgi:uncharacterized protein YodC (DUF2158 family)